MSLKTWKKEFYPITALQAKRTLDVVGLVEHAIQKWTGLKKSNLQKHDGYKADSMYWVNFGEGSYLDVTTETCSLCREFWQEFCTGCPLYESRGQARCDQQLDKEKDSPYGTWMDTGSPSSMLKALRKALKWAKEHSA